MLCKEGKLSFWCFTGTFLTIFILLVPQLYLNILPIDWNAIVWAPLLYYLLINMILRMACKGNSYQIAIRASFLGFILILSLILVTYAPNTWKSFGIYAAFMAIFHYSEYLTIAWSNPNSLSIDSFILNHSPQYAIAAVLSWIEYTTEAILFPYMKQFCFMWYIGILLCTFGEVMRKLAMITAKLSFNHLVQVVKTKEHKLITHGVYSIVRHPSYVGWFWWSIGTQIILNNPICIVLYAVASWKFFSERIYMEEITLLNFFGMQYFDYKKRVPSGLPLIKGFPINEK